MSVRHAVDGRTGREWDAARLSVGPNFDILSAFGGLAPYWPVCQLPDLARSTEHVASRSASLTFSEVIGRGVRMLLRTGRSLSKE
jgi:hypothetical protein